MGPGYAIEDIKLAKSGHEKIAWAGRWMGVLNRLKKRFAEAGTFQGKRVSICIHLEAKTAYLAEVVQKLGAEVWITSSNPTSAKDDVCAALAEKGIHVYARHDATPGEFESYLAAITDCKPHVIVDDGGDVCDYLGKHPQNAIHLAGICEETTTGVNRLLAKHARGELTFPALAINDARSKYLFDNRHGTGQSTWSSIMNLTNLNVVGKTVVVIGYGWVGRGVAQRANGLGAEIIVTEIDPWKAWEARMEGFRVIPLVEAAELGDYFVTCTGEERIVREEHFNLMKDGAFLSNAGHFGYELDIPALEKMAVSIQNVRTKVDEYHLADGRRLYLLANGDIINIAGGLGHPVEIMDMSFSLQLATMHYVLSTPALAIDVHAVPKRIDELVVREKMAVEGFTIDEDSNGES
ncbi:adenosylhomocysteinase [bacterium]|nr:adenosylhomocysteinase [bacterium]